MKLFDQVSEQAQKVLQQVEELVPSEVSWGYHYPHECQTWCKEFTDFFIKGKLLVCKGEDEEYRVNVEFKRRVSDGLLITNVWAIGSSSSSPTVRLTVNLERGREEDICITDINFTSGDENKSPKTVRHVEEWIRTKARPYFLKKKEADEAEKSKIEQLRSKYSP